MYSVELCRVLAGRVAAGFAFIYKFVTHPIMSKYNAKYNVKKRDARIINTLTYSNEVFICPFTVAGTNDYSDVVAIRKRLF